MVWLAILWWLVAVRPVRATTVLKQETQVNRIKLSPSFSTKVSARLGGYLFDIEGLTSPWAKVEFYSTQGNVNLKTLANDQGVFRFSQALMPLQTGDFCFTAIDTQQRASPPLCFSPPPPKTKTTIKGVILPPTLSLEKGIFLQKEDNTASGATTPDSLVKIFLFEEERTSFWELIDVLPSFVSGRPSSSLVLLPPWRSAKKAFAREGPSLQVQSNQEGKFSFNLPTFKSTVWRLFVGTQKTQLGDNPSPKSNIVRFAALSWWQWLLLQLIICLSRLLILLQKFFAHSLLIIFVLMAAIGWLLFRIKST